MSDYHDTLARLYNAVLNFHGRFPIDRTTPEQTEFADAMVEAAEILELPNGGRYGDTGWSRS